MRSKILLAAIGLIGVLLNAAPVSSQYGSYESIIAEPTVQRLPPVNSIAPVEYVESVELLPPVQPQHTIFSASALNTQAALPSALPAPMFQPIAMRSTPTQPSPAQPSQRAFERIQTPQADMILGPEIIESVLSEQGTCDSKKKKRPKIWSGNVEFGLDGTEGNSQTFNFHIGFSTKRKTERSIFTTDLDYNKSHSNSVNTANRLLTESRIERPHCSTPWTWYVHGLVDYDEFQPWNVQITGDTGIGYQIIESDSTDLTSRFGGGCSREIGGPDDEYIPELLFGLEFEHRRGDRHKFKVAVEYFPNVTNFDEFRMVDKASWEVLLDKELHLSLSFNVIDTINRPNPGGKQSDLDYSAVLLWNF